MALDCCRGALGRYYAKICGDNQATSRRRSAGPVGWCEKLFVEKLKTYSFVSTPTKKWADAGKYCKDNNMQLASIVSDADVDAAKKAAGANSGYWIGLHDSKEEHHWCVRAHV